MFLLPEQGAWIEHIIRQNPPVDLIGCSTNRLGKTFQLYGEELNEDPNILEHIQIAKDSYEMYGLDIEVLPKEEILAGMFLLFRKSLWNEFKFQERSAQFDMIFSDQLHDAGKTLGIARGIYLFHLYRLGNENPKAAKHLRHCQDFNNLYKRKGVNNAS